MNTFKKIASSTLVLLFVAGGAFLAAPRPAHAFWPVIDPTNLVQNTLTAIHAVSGCDIKVCVLDPIAWSVAKVLSQQLTGSIVHWINSGFNGGPAFITNLPQYLGNVSDNRVAQFFSMLGSNSLNSPFQDQITQALQVQYQRGSAPNAFALQNQDTMPAGYVDSNGNYDFMKGGLSGWFEYTQNPQNNALGFTIGAQNALSDTVQSANDQALTEANWGQGFLSYRGKGSDCITPASTQNSDVTFLVPHINPDGSLSTTKEPMTLPLTSGSGDCLGGSIQTPASILGPTLTKALGTGFDSLTAANSIGEIISSLVTNLLQNALSSGLSSLSQSTSGSGALDQQLQTSTSLGGSASSANTQGLMNAISSEKNQVTQYQDNWQTIAAAANQAKTALQSASASACVYSGSSAANTLSTVVQPVIDQANQAFSKASAALADLNQLQTQITNAKSDIDLNKAAADFQTLTANGVFPSADEIAYAAAQSLNNSDTTSGNSTLTLVATMNAIIAETNACMSH
ncbi:MAG: hypothetical protein KGI41_04235 [Patescibacteria group bacterium]|nr:hypothetical protein [Patescibacteria group bacterium]